MSCWACFGAARWNQGHAVHPAPIESANGHGLPVAAVPANRKIAEIPDEEIARALQENLERGRDKPQVEITKIGFCGPAGYVSINLQAGAHTAPLSAIEALRQASLEIPDIVTPRPDNSEAFQESEHVPDDVKQYYMNW